MSRASAVVNIVEKAAAYCMKGVQVDGMNVLEVFKATNEALKRIRAGQGPQFLEMLTYRYEGHSIGDPLRYRTKDEVEKWREDDPIGVLERHLIHEELVTSEELEAIDNLIDLEIEESVRFAEESPLPAPEDLFTDIYVEV